MKCLVIGHNGQVATCLRELASNTVEIQSLSREQADLTQPDACAAHVASTSADVVINAAAYTAVDKAETDAETAEMVNHVAVGAMANAAATRGVPFLHISTDYVFPGNGQAPWSPDDQTGPLGVYGATKLRGELAVAAAGGRYGILRTSWVFSAHGNNFVKTMLRLGKERDALGIVGDQIGGPTAAADIAAALLTMAAAFEGPMQRSGTWHFSGTPDCSWADFAAEIFRQAGIEVNINAIPTQEYPTPATRPLNSRLDCTATTQAFGIARPDWRESLRKVLNELGELA